MAVPVVDKASQSELELAPDQAQAAWLAGDVAITDQKVRVKRGTSTGTVAAQQLPTALAEGWALSDDEEAEALTLRRQESDASSLALGAVERALAGATLGLSSQVAVGLGADSERMAARADEFGGFGEALEVGGAILPGLLTGFPFWVIFL